MHARRLTTTALATAAATGAALALLPAGASAEDSIPTGYQSSLAVDEDRRFAQPVPVYAGLGFGDTPVLEQCNKGVCEPTATLPGQTIGAEPATYAIQIVLAKAAGSGVAFVQHTCASGRSGAGFDVVGASTETQGYVEITRNVDGTVRDRVRVPIETAGRDGGTGYYLCVR